MQCVAQQTGGPGFPGGQEHQLHGGHVGAPDHPLPLPHAGAGHPHPGQRHQGPDRRLDRGPGAESGEAHQGGGPHRVREAEAERGVPPPARHRHRHSGPGNIMSPG